MRLHRATADGEVAVFLWERGVMKDIGAVGANANARAISQRGQIVGDVLDASLRSHAFSWARGMLTWLEPTFGDSTVAYDVNELGQVVGASVDSTTEVSHATLWTPTPCSHSW